MSAGEANWNSDSDDLTLAHQAAVGDSMAFKALVDRHSQSLFRLSYSLTATRADAEDLLQETLVGAFGSLKNFNGTSSVKTWLTSILMRQAAKAWHRNRHHRQTRSIDNPQSRSSPASTSVPVTANDSSRDGLLPIAGAKMAEQTQSDLRADLEMVLRKLDPAYREILLLREMQQMSYDQIAASLGIPRGTVESRLYRARNELRKRLKDYQ